jgi:hypothetical protein
MLPDPARFGFCQLNDPPHPLSLHRSRRRSTGTAGCRPRPFPKTPQKEAVDPAGAGRRGIGAVRRATGTAETGAAARHA